MPPETPAPQPLPLLYRRALIAAALVMLASALLGSAALVRRAARLDMAHELSTQGKMLADLAEQDGNIVIDARLLGQLLVNPDLLFGCVMTGDNKILGSVKGVAAEKDANAEQVCRSAEDIPFWKPQPVRVLVPILSQKLNGVIGVVVLVAQAPMRVAAGEWALAIWGWLAVLAAMGLLLMRSARRRIEKPLLQIAALVQRVSLYKDYSLRLSANEAGRATAEIQTLTEAVNGMLVEIEDRDSRLTHKNNEIEEARQAAVAANSTKAHFLSNISHELRTPLNAIIGFSTMLAQAPQGSLSEQHYQEYVRDIHDSGVHLLDVINDILDLSKAESGQLRVTLAPFALAKVVEKALHIVEGEAHSRKIDIYTDIPAKMPKLVADRVRVMQMLLNLLSNALKFTPQGGSITIRARVEEARNHIHYFELAVEDTGFGMSAEQIEKAFVSFNQAEAALNRKYDGAGLGLPLTKRLVEMHRGKISISSVEGRGTVVTIRLPSDAALLD